MPHRLHTFDYRCMHITTTATLSCDRTALALSPMGRWMEWDGEEGGEGGGGWMYVSLYVIDLKQAGGWL